MKILKYKSNKELNALVEEGIEVLRRGARLNQEEVYIIEELVEASYVAARADNMIELNTIMEKVLKGGKN